MDDDSWVGTPRRRRRREYVSGDSHDSIAVKFPYCPACGGRNVPVYKSQVEKAPFVRYHKCSDCGHNFKSIED